MESIGVVTLVAFFVFAAARLRSRAMHWLLLRILLDVLFLFPLLLPLPLLNIISIQYLCGIMGFRKVQQEQLDVARLQGLGFCGRFWRLTFPTAWVWLLAGLMVGWIQIALAGLALMFSMFP